MRLLISSLCLLLLQACKHPLAIQGEGDIVERLAGVRGCTLEDFQASSPRCAENEVAAESYTVSYEAIPRPGWVFTGWEGTACSAVTDEGYCEYDMAQLWIDFANMTWPGIGLPPTRAVFKLPAEAAVDVFEDEVAGQVLGSRCMACHVEGGVSGFTRLVFDHQTSQEQAANNIAVFQNFIESVDDGREYILTKIRGGNGHGGGSVFSAASDEYIALAGFLSLLEGVAPSGSGGAATSSFWENIEMADAQATLRRAAIIMAGRLPTKAEITTASRSESGLRSAIRGLMTGQQFHDFLTRGANDRLLTDSLIFGGVEFAILSGDWYPISNARHNTSPSYFIPINGGPFWDWYFDAYYGLGRAPLELIAHVVESEKPYTEIVTADYTMVNRASAVALNVEGLSFADDSPAYYYSDEFLPARNRGQIVHDENYLSEHTPDGKLVIHSHGDFVEYPHAGILNEPAFLARYPTTETNRNRARARWTFYHFLGVDIEKAAGRTTNPAALADTNNPTLNNPNCAVCHQLHDPVAGAFQDFTDDGQYRTGYGGLDSLPDSYKYPADGESPWLPGDLWYRDMRAPGIGKQVAPVGTSSIQWLGQQIAEDPRFATAALAFWWPALMGSEILEAPEVSTDSDFSAQLQAYEQQQRTIEQLAEAFREGFNGGASYNLKDLLVEMVLSEWFRAEGATRSLDAGRDVQLRGVGTRRLLTPEELEEKTARLTGIRWGYWGDSIGHPGGVSTALKNEFNLYYGDIDSAGITERARQLTPVMVNVAKRHALQIACPFIVEDINAPDSERYLFGGLTRNMTPATHEREIREKLIEWHELLLGEKVRNGDIELEAKYELLVNLWEARRTQLQPGAIMHEGENCFIPESFWQGHGLNTEEEYSSEEAWQLITDPEFIMGTWTYVLISFLTDFNYLHE